MVMMATPWVCRSCRSHLSNLYQRRIFHRSKRSIALDSRLFQVSEEVRQAVAEQRPVVALESTIYTHGIPHPDNLALAARLESLIRINGGVPATVGILEGVARVGMGADELMRLVSSAGSENTVKVSRRDLGFALGLRDVNGKRYNGGTTVAGTMILAHLAGIKVFATGGLGGVHRGVEQTMDVSADLTELGRTPVAVISSGCKSFLDIPRTLEYLETQGVAVATFADARPGNIDFPAFWSRDSGYRSPMVLQDEMDAARVIHSHGTLNLQSGFLFANPIPEQFSIPLERMESAIRQAIEEAKSAGATGAASTPYILAKIKELTGSESLVANKALVEANVIRGTKVAVALAGLRNGDINHESATNHSGGVMIGPGATNFTIDGVSKGVSTNNTKAPKARTSDQSGSPSDAVPADIFVAGSFAIDLACDYCPLTGSSSEVPTMKTSNPAKMQQSLGGVGHNVAKAAHLMGAKVQLCSVVGDDLNGKSALEALSSLNMSLSGIRTLPQSSTAQYVALNDKNKDLFVAMADMTILEPSSHSSDPDPDPIISTLESLWLPQILSQKPSHLILDANWTPYHLSHWLKSLSSLPSPPQVLYEPVSIPKSTRLFSPLNSPIHTLTIHPNPSIHISTPNSSELTSMHTSARAAGLFEREDWWQAIDSFGIPSTGARTALALGTSSALVDEGIPQQALQLLPFIPILCVKLGKEGVLVMQILGDGDERLSSGECAPYILSRCGNGMEGRTGVGGVYMRLFPAVEEVEVGEVVSVNGVGDTFAGTLVAGLVKRGKGARVEELVDLAQRAAVLTLKSREAVSPGLGTLSMLL